MKLLYLHSVPFNTEKANLIQVFSMCRSFQKLGIDTVLAVPETDDSINDINLSNKIIKKFGCHNSFSIITYPKKKLLNRLQHSLSCYWGIKNILKTVKADICFTRIPFFLELALKAEIPTIFESHNNKLHNTNILLEKLWKYRLIKNSSSNFLVMFITISNALAKYWIQKGVHKSKVISLHDGFDLETYKKSIPTPKARTILNLDPNKKIVVYTGSLYKNRGIENIIALAKKFTDVEFIVIGGPQDKKIYYENIINFENIENVKFTGRIDHNDVPTYLFAADVLLMIWTNKVPTINYCSPLKMFEYMASGKLIVGHGFPTIKEVLSNGENALLANPNSFEDLESKLRFALTMHYPNPISDKAKNLAISKYSWENRAKQIYHKLLSIG